ncbi:hypothetical protein BRC84_03010 [Halobacteriales archaeon QS_1_68_44]|nr:MAG: hypothetical protein BRC84_03010 [Halobacteriales archaeon QS_1_68_44]
MAGHPLVSRAPRSVAPGGRRRGRRLPAADSDPPRAGGGRAPGPPRTRQQPGRQGGDGQSRTRPGARCHDVSRCRARRGVPLWGVVQNRLRERLSAVPAVAVAGVLFAAVHVISAVGDPAAVGTLIVLLVPAGLVLGAVYEYTGNLVVPWLVHSTHNSVLLTAILVGGPEQGAAVLFALLGVA